MHTLVEVMHCAGDPADCGLWCYLAIGSGIYVDVGRTLVFTDHRAAMSRFSINSRLEWGQQMRMCLRAAVAKGFDSLQFTHTRENILKYEIWMLKLTDENESGCPNSESILSFRSGWGGCLPLQPTTSYKINSDGRKYQLTYDNANKLPIFKTYDELNDSPWRQYLNKLYGKFPSDIFPIDMRKMQLFHKSLLRGIELEAHVTTGAGEHRTEGCFYVNNMKGPYTHDSCDWIWVHRGIEPVPVASMVEVVHSNDRTSGKQHYKTYTGYWMYAAPGSGLFYNVGKTIVFKIKQDMHKFCQERDISNCVRKLQRNGYDSIQFTHVMPLQPPHTLLEIVDIRSKSNECDTCNDAICCGWYGRQTNTHCDSEKRFLNAEVTDGQISE